MENFPIDPLSIVKICPLLTLKYIRRQSAFFTIGAYGEILHVV